MKMVRVYHRTSCKNAEIINRTYLRPGSYVSVTYVSREECPRKLEMPQEKCQCVCVGDVGPNDLTVPPDGPFTSGGALQFQTTKQTSVRCVC